MDLAVFETRLAESKAQGGETLDCRRLGMAGLDALNGAKVQPQTLFISVNNIASLQGMALLAGVHVLDVSCNRLQSLAGLQDAVHLRVLTCNQNYVQDLGPLGSLEELRSLHISYNCLSTLGQLEVLKHLQLEELTLHEPIALQPGYNCTPNQVAFAQEVLSDFLAEFCPRTVYNKAFQKLPKHIRDLCGIAQIHIKQDGYEYEGPALFCFPQGKGRQTIQDSQFEGEFHGGLRHGQGVEVTPAFQYKGSYKLGQIQGAGLLKTQAFVYEGDLKNGLRNGKGQCLYADGSYYDGDFLDGQRAGVGTYYDTDGSTFTGEWKLDVANGRGRFIDETGNVVDGIWRDNEKID